MEGKGGGGGKKTKKKRRKRADYQMENELFSAGHETMGAKCIKEWTKTEKAKRRKKLVPLLMKKNN